MAGRWARYPDLRSGVAKLAYAISGKGRSTTAHLCCLRRLHIACPRLPHRLQLTAHREQLSPVMPVRHFGAAIYAEPTCVGMSVR
jgi:hypothetical protein